MYLKKTIVVKIYLCWVATNPFCLLLCGYCYYPLGSSLGTTLRNATNATYITVQAKRASQGFIGQAERSVLEELVKLRLHFILFLSLVRSACPINPWLARFACVALRKVVPN